MNDRSLLVAFSFPSFFASWHNKMLHPKLHHNVTSSIFQTAQLQMPIFLGSFNQMFYYDNRSFLVIQRLTNSRWWVIIFYNVSLYSHAHALITGLIATLDAFIYVRKSGPAKTKPAGAVPTPLWSRIPIKFITEVLFCLDHWLDTG